ncbi:unnamed protein product [Rotaria sp. Silwood1]|nr:unnamed protein product [Rotaria sp. Silwood1]CAF4977388.1 unnamed protein product [Rotaria sp. Silwood1]
MNKMVLEFVASTQKLYSQILAYTVFAFLRALINARYSAKLTSIEQLRQFEQALINESNPKKVYADLLAYIQNTILSLSWV